LRGRIRKAERDAQAETMVLVCPECHEEMRVEENADLEHIAYLWTQKSGAKSYRETPRDVILIANHPHDASNLIDRRTGERWLERLENAGGHHVD
jgi:hypothetical protein